VPHDFSVLVSTFASIVVKTSPTCCSSHPASGRVRSAGIQLSIRCCYNQEQQQGTAQHCWQDHLQNVSTVPWFCLLLPFLPLFDDMQLSVDNVSVEPIEKE
jgi:hypothetical protein